MNSRGKKRILVCVEGEKTDLNLMKYLFQIYAIDADYEIVPYKTNIYTLYNDMFRGEAPENLDFLQVLKEREKNQGRREILNLRYSDILLIFDMDPQDPQFSDEKLTEMARYFNESTDNGKLYINYPMVESFYHMKSIPDDEYETRTATLAELKARRYKQRVNLENRNKDYSKFAVNRDECDQIILQNIKKAWRISGREMQGLIVPEQIHILEKQLAMLSDTGSVHVLCTCCCFIADYNSGLITYKN